MNLFRLFLFLPRLGGVVGSHGDRRDSAPLSLLVSLNKGKLFIQWPRVSLTAVVLRDYLQEWEAYEFHEVYAIWYALLAG